MTPRNNKHQGGSDEFAFGWAKARQGTSLFISVPSVNPSQAKRLVKGKLCARDIGVNVHRVLGVQPSDQKITISAKAMNIDVSSVHDIESVALILSLNVFTLQDLLTFRSWSDSKHSVHLELSGLDGAPELPLSQRLEVAEHVVSNGVAPLPPAAEHFLKWLQDRTLATRANGKLALTEAGAARLASTWTLQAPSRCLAIAGAPCAEGTRWHAMQHLQDSGWEFKYYFRRRDLPLDLDEAYTPGNTKVWFVKLVKSKPLSLHFVCLPYLCCLAVAETLRVPVPNSLSKLRMSIQSRYLINQLLN